MTERVQAILRVTLVLSLSAVPCLAQSSDVPAQPAAPASGEAPSPTSVQGAARGG